MAVINPYVNFNGNCATAFEFYRSVFGGEFSYFSRFGDMPAMEGVPPLAEEHKQKVLHVSLPISKETVLMGSDYIEGFGPALVAGNNFSLSVDLPSKEEADTFFAKLSEGGVITCPIGDMFWGDYFGSFTDRFGINWMIMCQKKN